MGSVRILASCQRSTRLSRRVPSAPLSPKPFPHRGSASVRGTIRGSRFQISFTALYVRIEPCNGQPRTKDWLNADLGSRQSSVAVLFIWQEYMQETTKKHYWLYVLRLEGNRYYVGITARKDPHERITEHMHGFYSAQWVKKYKPIEPVEIIGLGDITQAEAEQQELKRTLQYMKKYGLQSTRGGELNYSGRYFKVGSRFVRDSEMGAIGVVLVLMLALLVQLIKF